MIVMIGAMSAAALAAEVKSAPARNPKFAVFHCTSFFGSTVPFCTEGNCICGLGIVTAAESFEIGFEVTASGLDSRGGSCREGMLFGPVPARSALKPCEWCVLPAASGERAEEVACLRLHVMRAVLLLNLVVGLEVSYAQMIEMS